MGTFYGQVRPLIFPAQEILVSTERDQRGTIILRGAVNAKDIFWYDNVDGLWQIRLGDRLQETMRKVRAKFIDFDFDENTDRGIATVRLPIIGRIHVTLSRATENDSERVRRRFKSELDECVDIRQSI